MSIDYVAYRQDREVKIGKFLRAQKNKLLVVDTSGRTDSVRQDHVLTEFSDSEAGATQDAAELTELLEQLTSEIDSRLLWEIFADSEVELDARKAAEEYFGSSTSLNTAATAKKLLDDSLRFRRKGQLFIPRSRSEVDALERRERKEAEKAAQHKLAVDFLQKVITGPGVVEEIPPELEAVIGRIEAFMFRDENSEAENLLASLAGRRPVREVGLEILEKLGRLNRNVDPQLLLHGIVAEFSENVKSHAESLAPFTIEEQDESRLDFRQWYSFSIDDDSTREVDDALSLRVNQDGSLEAGVHIADPSVFIVRGDCVDQVAARRALTLYLATCTVNMLPEKIGCDLASLSEGRTRPAVSVVIRFDAGGGIRDFKVARSVLQVQRRLSYETADSILSAQDYSADKLPDNALHRLHELAVTLRQRRRQQGALIFVRPEIMVSVENDQIAVKRAEPDSPSHMMVGEFMILANRLVAEFALSNDIPIIYRTQPPPAAKVDPPETYDPVLFERTVRMMRPTRFSTHPQPHSSLGLDLYTQISSPLRRFNDLAVHRQLAAHLRGEPAPYSVTELIEVLGQAEKVERANKSIEREVANYWLLEHLRREYFHRQLMATVVDPAGNMRLAELDFFMIRGILQGGEKQRPGTRVKVRVADVHPRQGRVVLQAV